MYLAHLDSDEGELLQAAVIVSSALALQKSGNAGTFQTHFSAVLDGSLEQLEAASFRLILSSEGDLLRNLVMTAKISKAGYLRKIVARLMLLEGVQSGAISAALTRAEFDNVAACPGGAVLKRDDRRVFTSSGAELLSTVHIFDGLDRLVAHLAALGTQFCYQVDFCRFTPDRQELSAQARSISLLRQNRVTAQIAEVQRAVLLAATRSRIHVEESIVLDQDHIEDIMGLSPVPLVRAGSDGAEVLGGRLHSLIQFGASGEEQLLHGASTSAFWANLTSWRPRLRAVSSSKTATPIADPDLDSDPDPGAAGVIALSDIPPFRSDLLAGDGEPYAFISYAHADSGSVIPLLSRLKEAEVALWFDHGLIPSLEWDDLLADRLSKSIGVVAILSPRSLKSRFCRREVKFADAIGKPILPVLMEPVALTGGLAMLFSSIQATSPGQIDYIAQIVRGWRAQ